MTIYDSSAKKLCCFITNENTESESSNFCFQCSATSICINNQCFWKQRDCYGLCPWVVFDNPEHDQAQQNIKDTYGESYFPKWEVSVGTNCMHCHCKDFKK